jgi:hypothetical protein
VSFSRLVKPRFSENKNGRDQSLALTLPAIGTAKAMACSKTSPIRFFGRDAGAALIFMS